MIHAQLFAGLGVEDRTIVQAALDSDMQTLNLALLDEELLIARSQSADSYRTQALQLYQSQREKEYFPNLGHAAIARARFSQAVRRINELYATAATPIIDFKFLLAQKQQDYDDMIKQKLPRSFIEIVNASLNCLENNRISIHTLFQNSKYARQVYETAFGNAESLEAYFAAVDRQFTFGRSFYSQLTRTVSTGIDRHYSIRHIHGELTDTLHEANNLLCDIGAWRAEHSRVLISEPDSSILEAIVDARDGDYTNPQKKITGN